MICHFCVLLSRCSTHLVRTLSLGLSVLAVFFVALNIMESMFLRAMGLSCQVYLGFSLFLVKLSYLKF